MLLDFGGLSSLYCPSLVFGLITTIRSYDFLFGGPSGLIICLSFELLRDFRAFEEDGLSTADLLSLSFLFSWFMLCDLESRIRSPSARLFLTSLFASTSIWFSVIKSGSSPVFSLAFFRGVLFSLLVFSCFFDCFLDFRFLLRSSLSNESSLFDWSVNRGDCCVVTVAVACVSVGFSILTVTVAESSVPLSLPTLVGD